MKDFLVVFNVINYASLAKFVNVIIDKIALQANRDDCVLILFAVTLAS